MRPPKSDASRGFLLGNAELWCFSGGRTRFSVSLTRDPGGFTRGAAQSTPKSTRGTSRGLGRTSRRRMNLTGVMEERKLRRLRRHSAMEAAVGRVRDAAWLSANGGRRREGCWSWQLSNSDRLHARADIMGDRRRGMRAWSFTVALRFVGGVLSRVGCRELLLVLRLEMLED